MHHIVTQNEMATCRTCSGTIAFASNRHGKRFAVSVYHLPDGRSAYATGLGANGNLTPYHRCPVPLTAVRETGKRYGITSPTAFDKRDTFPFTDFVQEAASKVDQLNALESSIGGAIHWIVWDCIEQTDPTTDQVAPAVG
jgi:hypothetical protein